MSAFDIDGKFFRGLTKAGDFFILGALTALFSLPVVTMGPALTAANYVALKEVRNEEGYVWRSFWKSFKQNFKQAFLIELIMIALGVILYVDLRATATWYYVDGSNVGMIFMYGVIGIGVIFGAVLLYVFSVLSQFDNTIFSTLKNSLIICTHHLPQTIFMVIATYGLLYFSTIYFTALIVTIPLTLYINAYILERVFRPFIKKAREEEDRLHESYDGDDVDEAEETADTDDK
ncbi:MAG: DUF624 domain-containing protein [Lachnospira sp.]|nr:DUF624 domain-containing protein [Lachnospira sp.]